MAGGGLTDSRFGVICVVTPKTCALFQSLALNPPGSLFGPGLSQESPGNGALLVLGASFKVDPQGEDPVSGGIEFDGGKFKELVLLLAARSTPETDPLMSRVKLNKLLYRIDFEAFRLLGRSVTGETYIKGEHGPMASRLPLMEDELGRRGYLGWGQDKRGDNTRKFPLALVASDESVFSARELGIIDSAIEELRAHGGRGAREWSHEQSVGWRLSTMMAEIPYEVDVIASERGPEKTVGRLRERVLNLSS